MSEGRRPALQRAARAAVGGLRRLLRPQSAVGWAQQTQKLSDLGSEDAVLAVATEQRSYAFLGVPGGRGRQLDPRSTTSGVTGSNQRCATTTGPVRLPLRQPASPRWAKGAAVASGGGMSLMPLVIIAGIGLLFIGGMMAWGSYRRANVTRPT